LRTGISATVRHSGLSGICGGAGTPCGPLVPACDVSTQYLLQSYRYCAEMSRMDMSLRRRIGREEFDYAALMAALSGYANPHRKITTLLRDGVIVRVKKGLYVFGEEYRRRPYSRELLANLVYGPSFVSLDYALSLHGLIPERVSQVTSVTTRRGKQFSTPVGTFVYRPVPSDSFHLGMTRVEQTGRLRCVRWAMRRAISSATCGSTSPPSGGWIGGRFRSSPGSSDRGRCSSARTYWTGWKGDDEPGAPGDAIQVPSR